MAETGEDRQNASGTLENLETEEELKVTINTLQRTAFVTRLCVPVRSYRDLIFYDIDNLYPNKIKSIAERSGSTKTAINTLSSFMTGNGFNDNNDLIINSDEQTLFDILRHASNEKSMFAGLAIHFNFNKFGEIIEINEITFESLRWNKDNNKLISNPNWKRRDKRKDVQYYPFNPDNVKDEIKKDGIDKYNGQVLYWIPRKKDIYPLCRFDQVIDDAQFEAESKIYKLSNIQNDYSIGGFVKYPSSLDSRQEIQDMKKSLKKSKGSANAGKIQALPFPPNEALAHWKFFEPVSRNNIDRLFKLQNDEARENIYMAFQQDPLLNGYSKNGMFNQQDYLDVFNYYNSFTETDRKELVKIFNKIISYSIWSNIGELEILPKQYIITDNNQDNGGNGTNND